jgi:hypothetical protein
MAATIAVLAASAGADPAGGQAGIGPTVTVRIEGATQTLLPTTTVTLTTTSVKLADATCASNSVAAAIDAATKGNWDRKQFTQMLLGETHKFDNSDYWAEWVNYKFGGGICTDTVQPGDQVLMLVDKSPPPSFAPTVFPLQLLATNSANLGSPTSVLVREVRTDGTIGSGTPTPIAGATVSGGGATATTDQLGVASLSFPAVGQFAVRATKAGDAPSDVSSICVHNGNDGNCGTTAPGPTAPATGTPSAPNPVVTTPTVAVTAPPVARFLGLADGQLFGRGSGPRLLRGTVQDTVALTDVALRLRRRIGARCAFYSARTERFVGTRCGEGAFFSIGRSAGFSYLLPARLGHGHYAIEVKAADVLGHRDGNPSRGRSYLRFDVR